MDFQEWPSSWRVTRLGALTALITSGSRGWAKYYSDTGSLFIRAQNINADDLNLDEIAFVRLPDRAEGLRTKVQQYDLLVTITGANVTKSALIYNPIEDAYVSQHVALVRLIDVRLSKFLFYSVISPLHGRKQLQSAAYGQGKPGLNLDNIRNVVVGLPPLLEQQEIIRRVAALFQTADVVEARYRTAKAYVDRLTPSILAKAFSGELVHQDPNDEPASILLNRIRAAHAREENAPQKPRRTPLTKTRPTEVTMLKPEEIQHTHLSDILKDRGPLPPEALWNESQLDIDDFYAQLKQEENGGLLKETSNDASKGSRLLEAA